MRYFDWLNEHCIKLVERDHGGGSIATQETSDEVKIFGKYTPHDNYMGHPFSNNLLAVIKLLKQKAIPYKLTESQQMQVGEHYFQINTYLLLKPKDHEVFLRFFTEN